jgi:hypothetical protein
MVPESGDVLVSKRLATTDYEISIGRMPSHLGGTHDAAIANARSLARQLRIDAWLTEDRAQFTRIASNRSTREVAPR